MTVLIYSYKDDGNDGHDLKMSLRSIERHLHLPIDEVVIVGDCPSWFTRGTYYLRKQYAALPGYVNVMRNVAFAGSMFEAEDDAIYLDDDYLLLDHVESVPLVYKSLLTEHLREVRRSKPVGHWYRDAFEETARIFQHRPEANSWELHRPMPIKPWSVYETLIPYLNGSSVRPFWRMLAGNLAAWPDVPVYRALDVRGERSAPVGSAWVSSDADRAGPWLRHVHERFGDPSRWEA
jgi:hypothetical protein